MSQGFHEISAFGEAWEGKPNFRVTPVGNYLFAAQVAYASATRGTEVEDCTVQIFRNGISDGNLEIYSSGILQPETHHLGLSVQWQTVTLDKNNNALIVTGKSAKMGTYTVTITPNGKAPIF